MAIIQKIRNRAGILVAVVIGAALVAFILGDFLSQGNVSFSSSKNNVAEINGKGISIQYYENYLTKIEEVNKLLRNTSTLDEQTSLALREQAWNDLINDRVLGREYSKLGIAVHGDELVEAILGNNPHPFVQQLFVDQNTGAFNPMMARQFWQNTNQIEDPNDAQYQIRLYLEDIIKRERLNRKFNTLLSKGMYVTSLEAKRKKEDLNNSVDFSYVVKRYTEIPDSSVAVNDAELKAYYKKHREEFKQEKSRDIRYVVWNIVPTEKDIKSAETWINDAAKEFASLDPETTWQYIRANSDIAPDDRNYADGDLNPELNDFAFSANEGEIYGPYFEDNTYKVAKLAKIESLPDSVKASHILLRADQNSFAQKQYLADSLMKLINDGADFSALAAQNSEDGSKFDGGNLGWFKEGAMVKPFSDTCFYNNTGDVKIAYTQFGIHIIKITAQSRKTKKVKVGILAREVRTDDADDIYFMKANDFGGQHRTAEQFDAAVNSDRTLTVRTASSIRESDQNVTGLENSRRLVRWAFEAHEGDISKEVYQFGDKYLVAVLDKIHEDDYQPFEEVKGMVTIEVRKEKKAEKLIAELTEKSNGANDISALASKLGQAANTATNIRFSSSQIPQLGREPELIAASANLEQGKLSSPIAGTNGVYVIQVDNKNIAELSDDVTYERANIERSISSRVNFTSTEVLSKLAKVEDNRILFY